MHASHIKKKKLNLTLNSSLKISKSAFYNKENFSEKKKKSNLYLMKIQISFVLIKISNLKIQINFEIREKNQICI